MKIIIPQEGKVTLSRDECIRVGKYVIGYWDKEFVGGSFHFRPSPNEGRAYYTAKLNNGDFVDGWTQAELRDAIIASGKNGIEAETEKCPLVFHI